MRKLRVDASDTTSRAALSSSDGRISGENARFYRALVGTLRAALTNLPLRAEVTTMADFIPRNDTGFDTLTYGISRRLLDAGDVYNIPPDVAVEYAQLHAQFRDALALTQRRVGGPAATYTKNALRKKLEAETRRIASIARVSGANAEQLVRLGLKPRAKARKRTRIPRSRPELTILRTDSRRVLLRLRDTASAVRGKPRGMSGAVIYTRVADQPSDNIADWKMAALCSRGTTVLRFGPNVPPGARIWFFARWLNPRLQAGPPSHVVNTYIGGGVADFPTAAAA